MTGLMFDKKKTGALDPRGLLHDQFEGKMTYLTELRDTVGLSRIWSSGSDPANITQEQFDASLAQVDTAVKSGWVRQVAGNSYVEDMAGGGAVLAMGWSGDVLRLLGPRPEA